MDAELMISFLAFRERIRSNVALRSEPLAIETEHVEGPFRFMNSAWTFRDVDGGCEVTFSVDCQLRNPILQTEIGAVFDDAMRKVVRAFERRATKLHGDIALRHWIRVMHGGQERGLSASPGSR